MQLTFALWQNYSVIKADQGHGPKAKSIGPKRRWMMHNANHSTKRQIAFRNGAHNRPKVRAKAAEAPAFGPVLMVLGFVSLAVLAFASWVQTPALSF
jgi:hypothetical protein